MNTKMNASSRKRTFFLIAGAALFAEPTIAGPFTDGLCAGIAVTESILPAVISLVTVAGAAWAMYMKVGGEWVQKALIGILAAGMLAASASIGGHVAGAKAKAMFSCAGGAGAMQQIIQNL